MSAQVGAYLVILNVPVVKSPAELSAQVLKYAHNWVRKFFFWLHLGPRLFTTLYLHVHYIYIYIYLHYPEVGF